MTSSDKDKLFALRDSLSDAPEIELESLEALEIYAEFREYAVTASKIINRRLANYYDMAVAKEKADL